MGQYIAQNGRITPVVSLSELLEQFLLARSVFTDQIAGQQCLKISLPVTLYQLLQVCKFFKQFSRILRLKNKQFVACNLRTVVLQVLRQIQRQLQRLIQTQRQL